MYTIKERKEYVFLQDLEELPTFHFTEGAQLGAIIRSI